MRPLNLWLNRAWGRIIAYPSHGEGRVGRMAKAELAHGYPGSTGLREKIRFENGWAGAPIVHVHVFGEDVMVTLKIEGMTCDHCVKAVSAALQQIPSVTDVRVDLKHGRAEVDGTAEVERLMAAVRAEGYGVASAS